MRDNQPVTQREFDYPDDATLLSVTDTQSHIGYANAAFLAVSGFEREEIVGQPHNIVRHPDMPPEAFADMWATLKAGESWSALVKNRRKDGDHYWVRANATSVRREGRLLGYMSVRTRPQRAEVEAVEELYRRFRQGTAGGLRFHKGLLVRRGLLRWTSALKTLSVRWRIRCGLAGGLGVALAAAAVAGFDARHLAVMAAAGAVGGALTGLWLERQIADPLSAVLRAALLAAEGNPERHATLDRVDEIGMLMRAVNQSALNLRSLLEDVRRQVGGLQEATAGIFSGNRHLSARTEQTAASLQQTAASMEELGSSAAQNAERARQAHELASGAAEVARRGGHAIGSVVETMQGIDESSRRIADIIGMIDSIAFQTNILALNASVEAARAGEQGRGFAVVASEVRGLAGRSAEAAREIKRLVADAQERVANGSMLVGEAGQTMQAIVASIGQVADIVGEISHASAEQSAGVAQVGEAVSLMDRATQENAALVEQSAAAAQSLKGQAESLHQAVAAFARC